MRDWRFALALALGATLAGAGVARAQGRYIRPYELNVHAGAFFPDQFRNDDTEAMFGGRILVNLLSGWSFGGSFDWVPRDKIPVGGEDIDINTYLYSGGVEYNFSSQSTTRLFVGAGLGAATTKFADAPESIDDRTDLMVPLAVGVKWFDRPIPAGGFEPNSGTTSSGSKAAAARRTRPTTSRSRAESRSCSASKAPQG